MSKDSISPLLAPIPQQDNKPKSHPVEDFINPEKEFQLATFRMDKGMHSRLKVFSAKQGKPMVKVIEEALALYMSRFEE